MISNAKSLNEEVQVEHLHEYKMNKIIMHIDMNDFLASVEQQINPSLRGESIAVIGSNERTVVTTTSYEARAYGVKTGMTKYEAKRLCPPIWISAKNWDD